MKYYRLGSSAPRIRTRQPYEYGVSKKKYKYTIGALLGDGSLDVPGSLPEQGGGGGGGGVGVALLMRHADLRGGIFLS